MSNDRLSPRYRRGVVAVIPRQERVLVIQRSQWVVAPLAYCFPGGGMEPGESEEDALRRELREELGVRIEPLRRIWRSTTDSGCSLAWWLVLLPEAEQLTANPAEVATWDWYTREEAHALPGLLQGNRLFLAAWERGEFDLA